MTDPITLSGITKTGLWGVNRTEVQPFVTTSGERAVADFLRSYSMFRVSAAANENPLWGVTLGANGPQFGCIGENEDGHGVHFYGSVDFESDGGSIVHATLSGSIASGNFTLGSFTTVFNAPGKWRIYNTSVCNDRDGKPLMIAEINDRQQNKSCLVFLKAEAHGEPFHLEGRPFYNIQGVGCPELHIDDDDAQRYFSFLASVAVTGGKVIHCTQMARTFDLFNCEIAPRSLLAPTISQPWSAELWNNSDVASISWPGSNQVNFFYTDGNQARNDTHTADVSGVNNIRTAYFSGSRSDLHRAMFAA